MKFTESTERTRTPSRLPQGRRGLKWCVCLVLSGNTESPPAREAWIEINQANELILMIEGRLPQGRRGLKLLGINKHTTEREVASRKGGVD